MPKSNVVITGLGVVSSLGIGSEVFFDRLVQSHSGICSLSERTDGHAQPDSLNQPAGLWVGGPILDFDAKQYVRPRKALKVMCREIQLSFAASQLAIEEAGLADRLPADPQGSLLPGDIGTVFGSEMFYGLPTEMEEAIKHCLDEDGSIDGSQFGRHAMRDIMPLWMLKYLPNMPACHVGISINAHGPNNSIVLGDVSGPAALIEATTYLQRGIAKTMVSGAVGSRINTTRLNYSADYPIAEIDGPIEDSSQPHGRHSTGVIGGEAAVSVILESDDAAHARDAKPLARIRGWANRFAPSGGMNQPIRIKQASATDARGSALAIRLAADAALTRAGLSAGEIGMVVCHGMGDPAMDLCERQALTGPLAELPWVAPIASLGHAGAASGMLELAVATMSLARGVVPPTRGAANAVAPLLSEPSSLTTDHALCLTHNSEGNATAIVLERAG